MRVPMVICPWGAVLCRESVRHLITIDVLDIATWKQRGSSHLVLALRTCQALQPPDLFERLALCGHKFSLRLDCP